MLTSCVSSNVTISYNQNFKIDVLHIWEAYIQAISNTSYPKYKILILLLAERIFLRWELPLLFVRLEILTVMKI